MNRPQPTQPRPRLGRGLESLIPLPTESESSGGVRVVGVDEIKPSAEQVRRRFDAETMRELADSIRAHGLLQPVLVRRLAEGYQLLAGERRWRAAQMAGLERIPALVREGRDESERLVLGLIENLQREDLDPIEEARGIHQLIDQFGLTHEEAAARLGKNRVSITQALRLLNGCPALQAAIAARVVSAGHGRALVGLPSAEAQEQGLKVIVARRLSVRQAEQWVRSYKPQPAVRRNPRSELASVSEDLSQNLGLRVRMSGSRSRGQITIHFAHPEELDRILDLLTPGA